MSNIFTHPKYEELLNKLNKLKDQMTYILEDRAYLMSHKFASLKAEYVIKIGAYECDLFKLECKIARAKRKISMIQVAINRQIVIDMDEIDEKLDEEFKIYMEELEKMIQDKHIANHIKNCKKLTEEESWRLKRNFRRLAKKLHPDLNPELTEEQRALWMRVKSAYEIGDIEMLQVLSEIADRDDQIDTEEKSSIEYIRERIQIFENKILEILEEMDKMRGRFPFNQEELLKDEGRVRIRQRELKQERAMARDVLKGLEAYMLMLMSDTSGYYH